MSALSKSIVDFVLESAAREVAVANKQTEFYRQETHRWKAAHDGERAARERAESIVELQDARLAAKAGFVQLLQKQNSVYTALLDWAETLLCNAVPMAHCSAEEWETIIKNWRDEKHGGKQ